MKTATAAKMAAQFNDYLDVSRDQPVLITRKGKPVAVLISVKDKSEAEKIAAGHPRSLRSIFAEASEQFDKGMGIPHDEFWRQVEQSRRAKREPKPRGQSS